MPDKSHPRLLVTGASGHLGRKVVELLLDAGATNITAASRDTDKLTDLAARGAKTVRADFDDPTTLDAAFAGSERILIVSTDALGTAGQRRRQHLAAVEAAVKAGVRQILYTSMPHPEPGSLIPFAPDHYATEQAIEQSGVPFTILRVNWYDEAVFLLLPSALTSGQWLSSAADGRVGYVARDDVARAAAAALLSGVAEGRLDITGPEALSTNEIALIAHEVFGSSVAVAHVSDEQLSNSLLSAGLPNPLAELLVAMDANTRAGGVDIVTDTVARLTGRPARSLREFLTQNRAALTSAN